MLGKLHKTKTRYRPILAILLAGLVCLQASGSVFLPPASGPIALPGTTSAAELDLAGVVIYDTLIPFEIWSAGGVLLYKGNLQNRVVESDDTGELHFYYRIRDTVAGLPGDVLRIDTVDFAGWMIHADWRIDGLGMIAPVTGAHSAFPGSLVRFNFPAGFDAGDSSKFCLIKTDAFDYAAGGLTKIKLVSGESVVLPTVMPD